MLTRRHLTLGILAAFCSTAVAWAEPPFRAPARKKILFVCQFGTVKSPIARELLKRRAAERGIDLVVTARGITPEHHLPDDIRSRLSMDGIDAEAEPLEALDSSALADADLVVAFDPLPSSAAAIPRRDWSDTPSVLKEYPKALAEIGDRIDELLDELQVEATHPNP